MGPGGRIMMVATRQTILPAEVIDHSAERTASIDPSPDGQLRRASRDEHRLSRVSSFRSERRRGSATGRDQI